MARRLQRDQAIQRTRHVADGVDGDARVERGRIQAGVSEQNLNHANVDVLLQQVRGEAMALIPNSE